MYIIDYEDGEYSIDLDQAKELVALYLEDLNSAGLTYKHFLMLFDDDIIDYLQWLEDKDCQEYIREKCAKEAYDCFRDSELYRRDPYAYNGLSIHDFI